jgi:RNA polymerase subunit RPABC4/transcription elongation factor Spt4
MTQSITSIHLFVQEGCRPCMYAETQLKKTEGWEEFITITDAKENGDLSEFAKECGVTATPTLVVFKGNEIASKKGGSQSMTSDFWKGLVQRLKVNQ